MKPFVSLSFSFRILLDSTRKGSRGTEPLRAYGRGTESLWAYGRGTESLRAYGFTVFSEHGEQQGPTSNAFNAPFSRAEMMEVMVYLIKLAYSPGRVNVAVWDAEMNVDVAKFCGLEECGTASSGMGLGYMYRFAVFRGVGQIKWTGESHVARALG